MVARRFRVVCKIFLRVEPGATGPVGKGDGGCLFTLRRHGDTAVRAAGSNLNPIHP
jgi:hypothetical protein